MKLSLLGAVLFCACAWVQASDFSLVDLHYIGSPLRRRTLSSKELDDELRFKFRHNGSTVVLNMKRNTRVNENAPMFTLRSTDVKLELEKAHVADLQEKQYQDKRNGGFFAARCIKRSNRCHPSLTGSFRMDGDEYTLKPMLSPRNQTRRLGESEKYILQKRAFKPLNFDNDVVNVKRHNALNTKIEREIDSLMKLLKRTKRAKIEYGVEIVFVVDHSIYNWWLAKAVGSTDAEKKSHARYHLKRYFALVANGLDSRYNSIVDDEISIYIRLQGYVISESQADSVWDEGMVANDSSVSETRGLININVLDTFTDAIEKIDFKGMAVDHAMMFTRDIIVEEIEGEPGKYEEAAVGVSTLCNVCTEQKTSVVYDEAIADTIATGAHELAHNLGAKHDGEGTACNGSDVFIMAASVVELSNTNRKNAWKFSSCSVNGFKTCFKEEESKCLTNTATHGNKDEWDKHVANLPGQIYSARDQCKQDMGENGLVCKEELTDIKNICFKLPCKDGEDGSCDIAAAAARGTSCGNKMWCIKGYCVQDDNAPSFKNIDDMLSGKPSNSGTVETTTAPSATTTTTANTTTTTASPPETTTEDYDNYDYYDYYTQ